MMFPLPVVVEKVVVVIGVEQKTAVGDFRITPFGELNEHFMEVMAISETPLTYCSRSLAVKRKSPSLISNF